MAKHVTLKFDTSVLDKLKFPANTEQAKVSFFLKGATILRNYVDKRRPIGSRQLECYVNFGWNYADKLPDGRSWKRELGVKYTGSVNLGYGGIALSQKEKNNQLGVLKRFGKYRIDVNGDLIEYKQIKFVTGIYILPDAWNSKKQLASPPYEAVNAELNKIRHIIENTYQELKKLKEFNKEIFSQEIKTRIKNGMPRTIVIPADKSNNTVSTIQAISKELAKHDGILLPDTNNPNKVPEDLRLFIPYMHANRISSKKLEQGTIDIHNRLIKKLDRYFDQTGNTLTVTGSSILDIGKFIKWRIYDNEESRVRSNSKQKNKALSNTVKDEAINVGTLNQLKKTLKYVYNRSEDTFECKLKFSTKHQILKEEPYDRDAKDVYLSIEQLEQFALLKLDKKSRLDNHRKLFIIGCFAGGYRISDLVSLKKPTLEKFEHGDYYTFHVRSAKSKTYTMAPIPTELNYIIESYPFGSEVDEHELRTDVKQLGQMCGWTQTYAYDEVLADGSIKHTEGPFNEMLQIKTCRKTYSSLLYNFYDLDIQECMNFTGHSTEHEFLKYLRIDKKLKAQKLINKFKDKPIFKTL